MRQADGSTKVEMVHHPGEVWLRYSHSDKEQWTKMDLRRECKGKNQHMYGRDKDGDLTNIATEVCLATMACMCVLLSECFVLTVGSTFASLIFNLVFSGSA